MIAYYFKLGNILAINNCKSCLDLDMDNIGHIWDSFTRNDVAFQTDPNKYLYI